MSEKQYRTLMLPPTGKKRDDYFDIVRGIAVFLMLWGHSIQYSSCGTFDFFENRLYQFIYSFHMPLFMLLAGYFFYFSLQKHSIGHTLLNRVRSLGIPLLVWGFFLYFVTIGYINPPSVFLSGITPARDSGLSGSHLLFLSSQGLLNGVSAFYQSFSLHHYILYYMWLSSFWLS